MALISKSQEREMPKTLMITLLSMVLLLLLIKVYGCDVVEREALLDVKRAITEDPVGHLNSWKGENCCTWHGIRCDPKRGGFVVKLDLSYNTSAPWHNSLKGTLSPSVAQLQHLRYLNLSGLNFTGVDPIPPSIGSLGSLIHLNLSWSEFNGILPPQLGNLSSLTHLDLSFLWKEELLFHDITWISGLSSLQVLKLEYTKVVQRNKEGKEEEDAGTHLILELNKLPSISELHLRRCGLRSFPSSLSHVNFTSLTLLDLSFNSINSSRIPMWLFNVTTLEYLDLRYNSMHGVVPDELGKLNKLRQLSLHGNRLTGIIPSAIGQLSNLEELNLGRNKLNGSIPTHIWQLNKLRHLSLSENSFTTSAIPKAIGQLSNLEVLILRGNNFNGSIPKQICKLRKLRRLYLHGNSFTAATIPRAIGQLSNLRTLHLGGNNLRGPIVEQIGKLPELKHLLLQQNKLSGSIPHFIGWNGNSSLEVIDLSNNRLEGRIPEEIGFLPILHSLHLNGNNLSGTIPSSLNSCINLQILDLMHNKLSGEIPPSFQSGFSQLSVLQLRANRLSGHIPPHLFKLQNLRVVDISHNHLTGGIPHKFANFDSYSPDDVTNWDFSSYYRERISLVQKGREYVYISTILQLVVSIDLSANALSGSIPVEIGKLVRLQVLNLSSNSLTSTIPKNISQMEQLESLDLSLNNISGHIPPTMASLSFLTRFNVSHNNLSGSIPRGQQFNTFNETAFLGNHLCGFPLEECSAPPQQKESSTEERFQESSNLWFIVGFLLGFIFGFWVFCGTFIVKKKWRYSYFQAIDRVIQCIHHKCRRNTNG